ncbi:FadR family transcriptional regulator [Taibaiella sp. KBW10]|uniref:FadR/GntR family transcriptional regulator n=1 Tax=Taibaiella sp. KBW10 TaxID=2153357 RepID=UPI000F5A6080|nr:FCD domain-containing protein [Taibaiella sp. KBW10]RQO31004.1 FadR family transcriptional regulator [Taibaiella sp. KBW10]
MHVIKKTSLAEGVAEALELRIKNGALAIDAQLPAEPELMKTYGVGRSSIREAIKILAQSGFVKVQQGLGTFVISHTGNTALSNKIEQADFAEIFEVRQILEIKIIEKAAVYRTDKQIANMRRELKQRGIYAQEHKLNECIKADIRFHIMIAESCGNGILAALYQTLSEHVERFFYNIYKDTEPFLASQELHEKLLLYIEAKNAQKAVITAQKIIGKL